MAGELRLNAICQHKPENIDEIMKVIGPGDRPVATNKATLSSSKTCRACVNAGGGHFEHVLKCQMLLFITKEVNGFNN